MNRQVKQVLALSLFATGCMAVGMGVSHRWVAQAQEPKAVTVEAHGTGMLPPIAEVAEKLNPTVVAITNKGIVKTGGRGRDPFGEGMFDFFYGPQPGQGRQEREMPSQSFGSGVLVSSDGEILTNKHVIESPRGGTVDKLEVKMADGRTFEAKVLGKDDEIDIALIKIDAKNLPFAQLGDSEKARVGDWVVAIGNPLGLEHTVTQGIISAKGRSARSVGAGSALEAYLQTDAAINRGNSGGPLLNLKGEILGINTAINPMGQNIGFAVPSNMVRKILANLRSGRPVSRGFLGVILVDLDAGFKESLGVKEGVVISDVTEGQAADKAGLKKLDVVVSVDGRKVTSREDLQGVVAGRRAGETIQVELIRQGHSKSFNIVLGDRRKGLDAAGAGSEEEADGEGMTPGKGGKLDLRKTYGFEVEALTPQLRRQSGLPEKAEGVLVADVEVRSDAAEKLQPGLLITMVGGKPVTSVQGFREAVKASGGKAIILEVEFYGRGNKISQMVSITPRR